MKPDSVQRGKGPPPVRIRPSSGARRPPPPLDASRPVGQAMTGLWDTICRSSPPWRTQLAEAWPSIVGDHFVRHMWPGASGGMDGRTLTVFAGHSVIKYEADRQLRDLAARIRDAVPDAPVDRVLIVVGQPQSDSG